MRKRGQKRHGFGRRLFATRRVPTEEDDPLFDEREMEFFGAGDERIIAPEH